MRSVCLCTFAAVLFAGGCAASKGESYTRAGYDFSRVEKVAVIEVTGRVQGEDVKNQISDFFVMELLKKGYTPVY